MLHIFRYVLRQRIHFGQYPLIGRGQHEQARFILFIHIHQHEADCVPHFIAEIPAVIQTFPIETHIIAGGVARNEHEPQGVCTVVFDNLQRVDAIAEGLGELPALVVTNQPMNQHVMEGDFAHLFHAGEYHADYPEEYDIIACYQRAGRVEMLEFFRILRPAQRGERPQAGAEPGIQRVFVLFDIGRAALFTFAGVVLGNRNMPAVCAVVGRNAVAPPNLAGNAPIADIFQPVHIRFAETGRYDIQFAILVNLHCGLCQIFHAHKPLQLYHRLNGRVAAFMTANSVGDVLNLYEISFFFQPLHHAPARLAGVFVHCAVIVHDADARQIMPQADLKVVRVVRGCDFYNACPEFHIYIRICHNGNFMVQYRN